MLLKKKEDRIKTISLYGDMNNYEKNSNLKQNNF